MNSIFITSDDSMDHEDMHEILKITNGKGSNDPHEPKVDKL